MPRIVLSDVGFAIESENDENVIVRWEDVVEIFAFKLDLLTYDTIRLGFRVDESGDFYEVDEDWEKYSELVSDVESRFTVVEDWWSTVAYPAFETNQTTLRQRTIH